MRAQNGNWVERRAKRKDERWGRLEVGWPVSRCGSSDYRKRVPSMGSTRNQEVSEEEGVTGQQGSEKVGLECRDTGKPAKKGVSRTGFDGKEGE